MCTSGSELATVVFTNPDIFSLVFSVLLDHGVVNVEFYYRVVSYIWGDLLSPVPCRPRSAVEDVAGTASFYHLRQVLYNYGKMSL